MILVKLAERPYYIVKVFFIFCAVNRVKTIKKMPIYLSSETCVRKSICKYIIKTMIYNLYWGNVKIKFLVHVFRFTGIV